MNRMISRLRVWICHSGAKENGTEKAKIGRFMLKTLPDRKYNQSRIGNGGIRLGINYSVSNETKWEEKWPNTEDFRLINYSFNTGNIRSIIGQIVTKFYRIFQQLNE